MRTTFREGRFVIHPASSVSEVCAELLSNVISVILELL